MMDTYEEKQIQELTLSVPLFKNKVEDFLRTNGLRLEKVDLYLAIQDSEENILAGGGLAGDTIKCIAVSEEARSAGLSSPLISALISAGAQRGYSNIKVFTKPGNKAIFESMGFKTLAQAPKAILMENGRGLAQYCDYLLSLRPEGAGHSGEISSSTVIIMNANPFHLGHRNLVERAAALGKPVYVIVVKEDLSRFSYQERLAMVRAGLPASIGGVPVTVCEGSDYQISAATFPTYFLKELTDASENQMRLDLDLFCRHIAPALNADARVVGSEPSDALTARYNALMKEVLPSHGISVQEFPRHARPDRASRPISGSDIRTLLDSEDGFCQALEMVPESSRPYLLADRAAWALRKELSLPCKPGLVGPDGSGAHSDMDYSLMLKSIAALRPFFARFAVAKDAWQLRSLGLEAEKAMLAATGGVNTHKGAIFALGLALFGKDIAKTASALDNGAAKHRDGVMGAMQMAREGYKDLFQDWLPYYRSVKEEEYGAQKTLLRIMSSLDDTCIIGRAGLERAREVKKEASVLLENFCPEGLERLCRQYKAENISPGGAADMLALTFFVDSTQKVNN